MTALASLTTPQDAVNQRYTRPQRSVYVGGFLLPIVSYTGQHDVGRTATGRLTVSLPHPEPVVANAAVIVQGGHNDLVGVEFNGFIPAWEGSISSRGDLLDIQLAGWSELLKEPFRRDMIFEGPVGLDALFVSLCQLCGVPAWIAEATTYANGSPVMLGGNSRIDDGQIVIKAHSSPLSQLQRLAEPYCYYISDTEMGPVKLHRVGGKPTGEPVVVFAEGVHFKSAKRPYNTREIVNVWDVNGQTYDDEWGGKVPIRSIADPDTVPPHPEIRGGYRYRRTQNSDLVRQDQADAVRNWLEINHSEADAPVRWEAVGLPGLAPGDCVEVVSPSLGVSTRYWLMGIDIGSDDRSGYTGSYEGWAGAGEEYPGIVDRITIPVQDGVWHGGDETVAWYANPSPQGVEKVWPITIPVDASVVNIRGWAHSWNSQTVAGKDTSLTVSRWEIWKRGTDRKNKDNRAEVSGEMPQMAERYGARPNFSTFVVDNEGNVTNAGEWAPFAINLDRLDADEYDLVFACGKPSGNLGYDDGEVRKVEIEAYGLTEAAGYQEAAP